jgi:hypothetical protein
MHPPKHLLSVTSGPDGDCVTLHADIAGLEYLRSKIDQLLEKLKVGHCDHEHLRTVDWAGGELSNSMLDTERQKGHQVVHQVELLVWTQEWKDKHGL